MKNIILIKGNIEEQCRFEFVTFQRPKDLKCFTEQNFDIQLALKIILLRIFLIYNFHAFVQAQEYELY